MYMTCLIAPVGPRAQLGVGSWVELAVAVGTPVFEAFGAAAWLVAADATMNRVALARPATAHLWNFLFTRIAVPSRFGGLFEG
jgi:hypothetical protein